jgi:hypothetical protein
MWHLNFTRVDAIDGKHIFNNTMDGVNYATDYGGMTNTEIACCMSHLRAIYLARKNGDKYALIMEDDTSFEFLPFWAPSAIESLIKQVPADTGIIQLAWFGGSGDCGYHSYYNPDVQKKGKFCYSASAYIITEKGMSDVLSVAHVSDTHIHIRKPLDIHLKSSGVADEYIYHLTKVVTTGLPLFMPDNSAAIMDTTITGRKGDHIAYQLRHYHDVLRTYATAHEIPIPFILDSRKFAYRLGDAIMGHYQPFKTRRYHKQYYPRSIVAQYFSKTNQFGRIDLLAQVVRENVHKTKSEHPSKNTIVVHLRLGDVLELSPHSPGEHLAKECFSSENSTRVYVKPLSYFKIAFASLPGKKVQFVYGSHFKDLELTKSMAYLKQLEQSLRRMGYSCSVYESNGDPDMDFLYLCYAPLLVTTGGGYSDLAKQIHTILHK